jgi:hypothetical protein
VHYDFQSITQHLGHWHRDRADAMLSDDKSISLPPGPLRAKTKDGEAPVRTSWHPLLVSGGMSGRG